MKDDKSLGALSSSERIRLIPVRVPNGLASEPSPGIAKSATPPSPTPAKSLSKPEFPMQAPGSLERIISYLTKKHGGNVHEKGIVTITSKSIRAVPKHLSRRAYAPTNVADLTSNHCFDSNDEPGQWVCWDFREMRVRPTHYIITAPWLKSWVVEGSLDGKRWTEIDRQTNNQDFKELRNTASFAVSKSAECRFIRLTQTDKRHDKLVDKRRCNDDYLVLRAVEFFGTLSE
jgi:hypothetical protein